MAESNPTEIIFSVEISTKKIKATNDSNTIFALYVPETIKINASEFKHVIMNFSLDLPEDIGTFLIVLSLRIEGLEITHNTNTNSGHNIRLELLNKSHARVIRIKKGKKLALFMTMNEGTEHFKTRFEKIKN